ncbi:OmpA family protein [Chakrabartia godavariana]|nr:OmpA family protein [Chakrabartia godavariana]
MRGRTRLCAAVLPLLLAGCAMSQLALGQGENGEAGSVAVLNSAGTEIAVVDKPGAVASVSGSSASVKTIDSATFDAKYADLLAALPPQPRTFVLYFKENSVEPTDESQAMLAEIFAEIKKRPGADLEITGHTDTVGSEEVNDAFSLRRAAEITSYLFSQGLDKTIVRIAGRGERELLEKTPDETASATNRRVEVIVR